MLFKKQIIQSPLTIEELSYQILTSNLFTGTVEDKYFQIREEKFFANKLLFPIINGQMVRQDNATNITVSFAVCKIDKIAISLFLILVLLLSVLLGILSHDIFLLLTILLWDVVLAIIFTAVYRFNCRRALKKILKLTNSKITE